MKKFILKKICFMIPMMIIISFIVFAGLELANVDPVAYLVSPDMAANTENIEALREHLGLNAPFLVKYWRWILELLQGNLGYSIIRGSSISDVIKASLPATLELAFASLILSTIIGIVIGMISAIKQNGIVDNIARFFSVLGTAIPQFFFGIIILQLFAVQLHILPIGGRMPDGDITFWVRMKHLILPSVTMSISLVSALMRYTRNSMLDVFNMDYVKTARAKGVAEWKVYTKHVFRNALGPVLVLLVFRIPMLIGGSVIIEKVFSWPGIGDVILSSITAGDYPVIMATTLLIAVVMLVSSLVVDILAAYLDPRIRYE